MSNFKSIGIVLYSAMLLFGCKPASYNFSYKANINKKFIDSIISLTDYSDVSIDSVKVYRAWLMERLVERDRVPEYTLLNTQSKQEHAKLTDVKNYHQLYLFEVFPQNSRDTLIIYLATSFSGDTICTKAGPVYFGVKRFTRLRFETAFSMDKKSKPHIDRQTDILFFSDSTFPDAADRTTPVRISQIVRNETNKIGGTKAVIFSTEKVFGDSLALTFTYLSTLK